jgi:hypothetical protein
MSKINESLAEAMTPRDDASLFNSLYLSDSDDEESQPEVSLAGLSEEQMTVLENEFSFGVDTHSQLEDHFKTKALEAAHDAFCMLDRELSSSIPLHHNNSILLLIPFLNAVGKSNMLGKHEYVRRKLTACKVQDFIITRCVKYLDTELDANVRLRQLNKMAERNPARQVPLVPMANSSIDPVRVHKEYLPSPQVLKMAKELYASINGSAPTPGKNRSHAVNLLGGEVAKKYENRKPTATSWRVPFKVSEHRIAKPYDVCSPARFRAWANYVCTQLHKTIPPGKKTSYVSGNGAAEALWFFRRFNGTRKEFRRLLSEARFYTEDYKMVEPAPPQQYLGVSYGLVVHSTCCVTTSQLEDFEHLFYSDRAVYRFAHEYLSGLQRGRRDLTVRARIQSTLDKRINNTQSTAIVVNKDFSNPLASDMQVDYSRPVNAPYLRAVAPEWYPESYVYQGNAQPVRVVHSVNIPNSTSVADAVESLVGETAFELGLRHSRTFVQFTSFFAAVSNSKSVASLVASILQFVSGNETAWKFVTSHIKEHATRTYQGLETELPDLPGTDDSEYSSSMPFGQFVRDLGASIWDAIVGAGLFILVEGMMSDIKKYLVGPLQDLIASTRISLMREAGKSVAMAILNGISQILVRIRKCWEVRSFAPLWGEKWDPSLWCTQVESVVANYALLSNTAAITPNNIKRIDELREGGLIPSWWMNPLSLSDYCIALEEMLDQGVQLSRYFARDTVISREILVRLNSTRSFLLPLKVQASASGVRPKPFYVFLFGEPGGGKTILQKLLAGGLARKFSLGDVESGTYQLALNENFQSGLNHHKWCVVADDIDHSVAPAAAGQLNHIELLTKLVNNEPFRVEESESSLKGHTFANPAIVYQQSNFPNSRVHKHTLVPAAWWRRIDLYVSISAKDEYGVNGVLDPSVAESADTYDLYNIDVQTVDYNRLKDLNSNVETLPLTEKRRVSFPEFLELYYRSFEEHRARELRKIARFTDNSGFCKICHMSLLKDCGHREDVVNQGRLAVCERFKEFVVYRSVKAYMWYKGSGLHEYMENLFDEAFWLKTASAFAVAGALSVMVSRVDLQGRLANSVEGLIPKNWFRANQEYIPGVPIAVFATTYTYDDLLKNIAQNWVSVSGDKYSGPAVLVGHNLMLMPTHYCPGDGEVEVECRGKIVVVPINEMTRVFMPHKELSLVKCGNLPGLSGLRSFILPSVDEQVSSYDEVRIIGVNNTYLPEANQTRISVAGRSLWTDAPTVSGDCGYLYIARINQSWRIVAMHFAGTTSYTIAGAKSCSLGAVFSLLELDRAAKRLATVLQGVYTSPFFLNKEGEVALSHFPVKSEVWAAVSHHDAEVVPFGTLQNQISGMTLKTRIRPSLLAPHLGDLSREWCGSDDYWRLPQFRGSMIDEKWTSPYTDAFRTQNNGQIHMPTMWLALADYLSGLSRVDLHGYAELSEEQMLSGVPGSYVHSVNMRTSVGPPFNVKKPVHISVEAGNSYMSPDMWRIYDDALNALSAGVIPAPLGLCILKDEGLKPGKLPRVFTVYSAAFNLLCKKKWIFKSLMRANPAVFESTVGINMTGEDALKLVHAFESVLPGLDGIYEADATRLDKSFNGELFDFVALVVYAMTFSIGLDAMGSYLLLLAVKNTRFCIKNDLFSVFWNGSGNDATVEINGICMSLGQRYVYYRDRWRDNPEGKMSFVRNYMSHFFDNPIPSPPFSLSYRDDNILWTYGDDQIFACLDGLSPRFEEIWAEEIGIVMTDASKEGRMRPKHLVDVQYLKRRFRFDPDLGRWVTPLDKKTMARMLMLKNDSTLTSLDGAAVSLTECLREAVYHGRDFYNQLRSRFLIAAEKVGITRNGYLHLPEFDHYKEKILDGSFQTWVDRTEILKFDFSEDVTD